MSTPTEQPKDFLGWIIDIGDIVIMMLPKYRSLIKGKVTKLTAKMAFIDHQAPGHGSTEWIINTKQFHDQITVVSSIA